MEVAEVRYGAACAAEIVVLPEGRSCTLRGGTR